MAEVQPEQPAVLAEAEPSADQGPAPAEPAAPASADSGVGVLGWLGFVIINIAAWGIIAVSSVLNWGFGFAITLVYTGILMGIATCLSSRGAGRYRSFENLLWVLACWFVFILGLYLSINVLGPAFDEESSNPLNPGSGRSGPDNDLTKLLPDGSSATLLAWADDSLKNWRESQVPTYAEFEGYVFFSGMSSTLLASTSSDAILLRSDATSTNAVTPVLTNTRSFAELQSKLFFLAQSENQESGLWSLSQSGASQGAATLIKAVSSPNGNYASVNDLIVDAGTLYFKANYYCDDGYWYESIFSSDGTSAGTANLRGADCLAASNSTGSTDPAFDTEAEKPTAQMWGMLLLGVVPMVTLASVVIAWKKMPGMFMNIFLGVGIGVILLYFIGLDEDGVEFEQVSSFLKWFITLYTAAAYIAITLVSIFIQELPALVNDMKDWIVVIVGFPFFVVIHFDLDIPVTEEVWAWALYAFLAGAQMLISIAVARTFPMVMGAISTFVISWKIAREIVRAIFGDELGEVETLTLLGILALQGIGIIAGAIMYASRRVEIETLVRNALLRCLKKEDKAQAVQVSGSE
mmetsp:Transcript_66659/g.168057  ORF Transcript_66659/g.168057 Transcript_66659/m.168057 type:complete len:578 (+) Transcript_66659:96-1829(+)|eukprot:CAMPEP_0115307262 /NCGR_PEP_ID=MMETSP0270-20121206/73039_1 /TAXON_ID=71861 /ORGANISM="Scrippsiella trochoidea, Strain CCMP3099" /LENGTH=577 /DNA_ID=CAMNT_0002725677 /DNA_START=76 /DNA_END=1809 /DNA_ORIENTATION=+